MTQSEYIKARILLAVVGNAAMLAFLVLILWVIA